jgi:hypothetical protein
MINQTLDLKLFELDCLDNAECISINGGTTDFAYDAGTFLRYSYYCLANNFSGQIMTIYQWAKQNGYK